MRRLVRSLTSNGAESLAQPLSDESEESDIVAPPEEVDAEVDIRPEAHTPLAPTRSRLITSTSITVTATIASFLIYYLGFENLTLTGTGAIFAAASVIAVAIQRALSAQVNQGRIIRNDPMRRSRSNGGSTFALIEPSDPSGAATGIRIVSIVVSSGVAIVTMSLFGGTLVTFGLTIFGSHLAITRLSHTLLSRLSLSSLDNALSYLRAIGLRVEEVVLTEFILRWLGQNNTSGYPAPILAREAILRARLQDRGADVLAGIMGAFIILLTMPLSGALWATAYGAFTYSTLRSLILAYLFVARRITVRDIQRHLQAEGGSNYRHQAEEIIRLSYALQNQFGDFLAVLSVTAERLFYVLRHIPFLLLSRLLPSSAQKIAAAVLGVRAAADTLALAQTAAIIVEGVAAPEDFANRRIDSSPLVRFRRAAVYSMILWIMPIIALFVVVNDSASTINGNIGMLLGSLVLLSILSVIIYSYIADIDAFVLRLFPALLRRAPLFFGRSEGATAPEIRAQQEADALVPDLEEELRREEALRREAEEMAAVRRESALRTQRQQESDARAAIYIPRNDSDTSLFSRSVSTNPQVELERIVVTADGFFVHRVITPVQDLTNPDAIRQVTLDPRRDGYVEIEYVNGRTVTHSEDGSTTERISSINDSEIQAAAPAASDFVIGVPPAAPHLSRRVSFQNPPRAADTVIEMAPPHVAEEAQNTQQTRVGNWFTRAFLRRGNTNNRETGIAPPHIAESAPNTQETPIDGFFTRTLRRSVSVSDVSLSFSVLSDGEAGKGYYIEDDYMGSPIRARPDTRERQPSTISEASEDDFAVAITTLQQQSTKQEAMPVSEGHSGNDDDLPPPPAAAASVLDTVITVEEEGDSSSGSFHTAEEGSDQEAATSPTGSTNSSSSNTGSGNYYSISIETKNINTSIFRDNTPKTIELMPQEKDPIEEFIETMRQEDCESFVNPFDKKDDENDNTRYDENGNPYLYQRIEKPTRPSKMDLVGGDATEPLQVPNVADYDPDRLDPTISSRHADPEIWETHPPIALKLASIKNPGFKSHGYHVRSSHQHSLINDLHPPKLIGDIFHHGPLMDFMSH